MVNWFKGLDTKWQIATPAIGALFILGVLSSISCESETPNSTQTDATELSQDTDPDRNATATPQPTPKSVPTEAVSSIIESPPAPSPTPLIQQSQEFTISISVSDSGCYDDGYDRDRWAPSNSKWKATRQAVAREEGPKLVGYWTRLTIASLSEADIDHHVPVKHAHMAGACHWGESRRDAFYTDLDNLNVTTRGMNRSKSDKAPGHWGRQDEFIDTPAERCEYAVQWINVKRKYELHFITSQETDELTDMLSDCGETPSILTPARSTTAAPDTTETPLSAATPKSPVSPPPPAAGEVKVYKNCAELREDYPNGITKAEHPEVYAANISRDRDKDGSACE